MNDSGACTRGGVLVPRIPSLGSRCSDRVGRSAFLGLRPNTRRHRYAHPEPHHDPRHGDPHDQRLGARVGQCRATSRCGHGRQGGDDAAKERCPSPTPRTLPAGSRRRWAAVPSRHQAGVQTAQVGLGQRGHAPPSATAPPVLRRTLDTAGFTRLRRSARHPVWLRERPGLCRGRRCAARPRCPWRRRFGADAACRAIHSGESRPVRGR